MKSLELFAGAGGLAMGIAEAGFKHCAIIERDGNSFDTLCFNKKRGVSYIRDWPLFQSDVRFFDYRPYQDRVDLISGGPPCQPFSMGGKHCGNNDHRDMFPEAVRAVREVRPKAFMFENVKGFLRESFSKYFEYVVLQLSYPEISKKSGEDWQIHLSRLEKRHTSGKHKGLQYRVVFRLLNAADYGVPQKRERVFIVGIRDDIGIKWSFPERTHSEEALWWNKWKTKEYWELHRVPKKERTSIPRLAADKLISLSTPDKKPWMTVRDALHDLPDPRRVSSRASYINHNFQDGARSYPGHTGSPLDEPAKTLKAGDHGVPGGENMMVLPDGRVRYFTIRESARLQTFPDEYGFKVSWTESMRQIGNAVPTVLAHAVAKSLYMKMSPESSYDR